MRAARALATAFVLLTVLVALHATDGLDRAVLHRLRPGGGWGPLQQHVQDWSDPVRPLLLAAVLGLVALVLAVRRRTVRPLVVAVVAGGGGALLTLLVKLLLHRADADGSVTGAGSYPSGHVVTVVLCVGLVLLLALGRLSAWAWVVVLVAAALLGGALLVQGVHWASDLLGGGVLGATVLLVSSRVEASVAPRTRPPG